MKDINVRVSTRASVIVGSFVLLGLIGAVMYGYKELDTVKRDLYGIRGDYYQTYEEDVSSQQKKVDVKLLNQEVQELRVVKDFTKDGDEQYETKKVRVVEVEFTNNLDYVYSYYDSLSFIDENGIVRHPVAVHQDDNKNEWAQHYGSLELGPGAKVNVMLYLPDTGQEITKLIESGTDEFSSTLNIL